MTDIFQDRLTIRLRKERLLLLIYAVAVTVALLVTLRNNNNVEASTPVDDEMENLVPEVFEDDSYFIDQDLKQTLLENAEEEAESLEYDQTPHNGDMISGGTIGTNEEAITLQKGDSFIGILTKMGLDYAVATDIYMVFKKVYDVRKLKVGQVLYITSNTDSRFNELLSIEKIMIEPVSGTRYIVEKNADGKYESRVEQDELKTEIKTIKGEISGNVSTAMQKAGVPSNITGNFINIFSFSVDFRRDVHAGDKFEIRFEEKKAPNGKVVQNGDIIFAALTLGKDEIALYRYKDKAGTIDYYDEKGLALKKTFDRKPLEYKKARISSRFGRRFHPILKTYRNHDGVDYAAPMGSKVFAGGDGVVTLSKWINGYGYMVKIRHNAEYTTGYAHLRSFAKGIRPGVRVKQGQVIAYVGSTGRSTGPHLHFEVIKNGRKVDPLKVKAATGENLTGAKLTAFKKMVADIKKAAEPTKELAVVAPQAPAHAVAEPQKAAAPSAL